MNRSSSIKLLCYGWLLYQEQWVMRYLHEYRIWIDVALVDRVTDKIYVLVPGISRSTVAEALRRGREQ